MTTRRKSQALGIIKRLGIVRPAELKAYGIPRAELYHLFRKGRIVRQARGIYVATRHPYSAGHSLAQVAKRVPGGVFCLLTALRFHGLTTQAPSEVWIALPEKARRPRLDYPRLVLGVHPFEGRVADDLLAAVAEHLEVRLVAVDDIAQ